MRVHFGGTSIHSKAGEPLRGISIDLVHLNWCIPRQPAEQCKAQEQFQTRSNLSLSVVHRRITTPAESRRSPQPRYGYESSGIGNLIVTIGYWDTQIFRRRSSHETAMSRVDRCSDRRRIRPQSSSMLRQPSQRWGRSERMADLRACLYDGEYTSSRRFLTGAPSRRRLTFIGDLVACKRLLRET